MVEVLTHGHDRARSTLLWGTMLNDTANHRLEVQSYKECRLSEKAIHECCWPQAAANALGLRKMSTNRGGICPEAQDRRRYIEIVSSFYVWMEEKHLI